MPHQNPMPQALQCSPALARFFLILGGHCHRSDCRITRVQHIYSSFESSGPLYQDVPLHLLHRPPLHGRDSPAMNYPCCTSPWPFGAHHFQSGSLNSWPNSGVGLCNCSRSTYVFHLLTNLSPTAKQRGPTKFLSSISDATSVVTKMICFSLLPNAVCIQQQRSCVYRSKSLFC